MLRRIALSIFALCLPGLAMAQGWVPDRPVRIILPFPPGGSTDLVGRILADRVSRSTPHPWVIENRPGANGNIGLAAAAKSCPLYTSDPAEEETSCAAMCPTITRTKS